MAKRLTGRRYIDINRTAAARYDVTVKELQSLISTVAGGENVAKTIEGRERFPINVRHP